MSFSKLTWITWVLLLAVTGCKVDPNGHSPDNNDQTGTFWVDEVRSQHEMPSQIQEGTFPFIKTKGYHLLICVKDPATLQPLVGHRFSATSIAGSSSEMSDANGCFSVAQQLTYNDLGNDKGSESLVKIDLTINGEATLADSLTIPLGIDPWNDVVADLRYVTGRGNGVDASVLSQLPDLSSQGEQHRFNLLVDEISFSMVDETHSALQSQFTYQLEFTPKFLRKTIEGDWFEGTIEKGRFDISLELWEQTEGSKDIQIASGRTPAPSVVHTGRIRLPHFPLTLVRQPQSGSFLYWKFYITPVGDSQGLSHFVGAKRTPIQLLRGNGTMKLIPQTSPQKEASQAALSPPLTPQTLQTGEFRNSAFGFYFKSGEIVRFSRRIENYTRDVAQAWVNLDVCLANVYDHSKVANQNVEVALLAPGDAHPEFHSMQTDEQGCLKQTHPTPITFSYFSAQQYMAYRLIVRANEKPYLGIENTIQVHINPWRQEQGFALLEKDGDIPPNPNPKPSRLHLANGSCIFPRQQHDLRIDLSMNLTFLDFFQCPLQVNVFRPFAFGQQDGRAGQSDEPIPVGTKLRVKTVLAGAFLSEDEAKELGNQHEGLRFISSFTTEVEAEPFAHNINRIIPLVGLAHDFSEKRLFFSFTRLYIQVEPLGDSALKPVTMWTDFSPFSRDANLNLQLMPSSVTIEELQDLLVPKDHFRMHKVEVSQRGQRLLGLEPGYVFEKPRRIERINATTNAPYTPFELFLDQVQLPTNLQVVNLDESHSWPSSLRYKDGSPDLKQRFESMLAHRHQFFSAEKSEPRLDFEFQVFMRPLCSVYLQDAKTISQCSRRPLDYIRLELLEFVDKVHDGEHSGAEGPARWVNSETNDFPFRMRVFKEIIETLRAHEGVTTSETDTHGKTSKFGLEFKGTGTSFVRNYSYGKAQYWGTEFAKTRDTRERIEAMKVKNMQETTIQVALDLTVKNCVLIRPGKLHPAPAQAPSFLICHRVRKDFVDSWHTLVAQGQIEGSPILDQLNPNNRFLNLIRGRLWFAQFQKVVTDRTKTVRLEHVPNLSFGPSHLLNDIYSHHKGPFGMFSDGGIFPGMSRYRSIPSEDY